MLDARIALVTGGSRGIGLAIARALAESGFRVALAARDRARLEAAAAEIPGALAIPADLRDPEAPARLTAAVEAAAGPIDLLVNNAGTAPTDKLERTSDAVLDEVLDLHVKAPFRLIRALLPGMKLRGRGTLIQLASTCGLRGFPLIAAYVAAKHAMVGLTRALAAELAATELRAYAVCPGFVDTDITRDAARAIAGRGRHTEADVLGKYAAMNTCGRMLTPGEVAAVVADLATGEPPSGTIVRMDEMPPARIQ